MARGTKSFEFDFLLMDVIPIVIRAYTRFGKVYAVEPSYQGTLLNLKEHLYDEENDFIPLTEYFLQLAQGELNMPAEDVVVQFIPEVEEDE